MLAGVPSSPRPRNWTMLTGHGRVLVEIARNREATMRELAEAAGLTERATQMIVADLEEAGYVTRSRVGRRNHYTVDVDRGFRHFAQDGHRIGSLLAILASAPREIAEDAAAIVVGDGMPVGTVPIDAPLIDAIPIDAAALPPIPPDAAAGSRPPAGSLPAVPDPQL